MIIDLDSQANTNLTHLNKLHNINSILPFFPLVYVSFNFNNANIFLRYFMLSLYLDFVLISKQEKFSCLSPILKLILSVTWLFQLAASKSF